MALRIALARRSLCTSTVSSQLPASLAAAAVEAAKNNPTPIPSDTLFVSGLNKRTTSEKLQEAFSPSGKSFTEMGSRSFLHCRSIRLLDNLRVVTDRSSGYSKGFGFVKYATVDEAGKGIEGMDAKFLEGWVIFAEYARPRSPPGQASPEGTNATSNRW